MRNIQLWCRAFMIAVVFAVAGNVTCQAYDFSVNGIYYNVITATGTAEVTFASGDYNSYSGRVVIPSTVKNGNVVYQVTRVGDNAFRNCPDLTSVKIGANVATIGKRAFLECTALTGLTITPSIIEIGDYAFTGCSSLRVVSFDNDQPVDLGAGAFMRCSKLKTVNWLSCDTLAGRGGINSLGTKAFAQCPYLENMILPGSLKNLGISIFEGSPNLKTLYCMKEAPIALSGDPFSLDVSKVTIYVPSSIEKGRVEALYKNAIGWRDYNIVELPYTFIDKSGYTYFKTSESEVAVTGNVNSVDEVVIRKSIVGYNDDAYSVTAIGENAFQGTNIQSLNTQNAIKLKTIGAYAFEGCTQLSSVMLTEGISYMGERAFAGCSALTSIQVPSTLRTVPAGAFENCSSLTSVNLVMGVSQISENAFAHCTGITSLFLPRSVMKVEHNAFRGMTSLTQIIVDENSNYYASVEGVLFELKYGEDVDELGEVNKLVLYPISKPGENFYVPCGVTSIEDNALEESLYLKHLAIPYTVGYFGADCFKGTNIEIINYRSSNPISVTTNALSSLSPNILLQVPNGAVGNFSSSESWGVFTNIVERYDVYHNSKFAYEWNSRHELTIIDIQPSAVTSNGTLTLPESVQLSSYTYFVTELGNTATANVGTMVKKLNIASDSLAVINMSDNINPIAMLKSLQSITISNDNPYFNVVDGVLFNEEGNALYYYLRSKSNEQYIVDNVVVSIMPYAFAFNPNLKDISFGKNLRLIGVSAFEGCDKLQTVGNCKSLVTLRERAFAECAALTTFNGGESLNTIGDEAFINCDKLSYFPFGHSALATLGNHAFKGCASLSSIVMSNVLSNIGDGAFEDCSALTKVLFIRAVDNLGQQVFKGCNALNELWLCNTVPPVVDNDFFAQVSKVKLYVPQEAVGEFHSAMPWGNAKQINSCFYLDNGADVNNDNEVTAIDVTLVYSFLLGHEVDYHMGNFDVNRDGSVTASDITAIYDCILTGVDITTRYNFKKTDHSDVAHFISMSGDHQMVIAIQSQDKQEVTDGLSGYIDNNGVAHVVQGSINDVPHLEVVPTAPGYCVLVAMVLDGGVYYYRTFPLEISQ